MSSNAVTRVLNKELINALAFKRAKVKLLNTGYQIDMYGTYDDEIFRAIATKPAEPDKKYDLCIPLKELDITEDSVYGYWQYRFNPRNIKRYDAIRIERPKLNSEDKDWYAYNAVVIQANVKMISFVMNPSRGPVFRYLTARSIYTNNINIYRYSEINNTIDELSFILPSNFICSEMEPVPMTNDIVWGKIEDPCEAPECKDYIWVSNMVLSEKEPTNIDNDDIWGFTTEDCT